VKLYDLKDLEFSRNSRFTLRVKEFALELGEKVALVGQNGSGKSTLLRLLSLLEEPSSSERFSFRGKPLSTRAALTGLGYLQQQPYLFHGTVSQNLAYPLRLKKLASTEIRRRVGTMLATMELDHLARARARELSGGEQKRLALGRVLIAEPDFLFLDEPTSHLDLRSRSVIETILKRTEKTVLLATHELPFALRVTDRVLHMREGRVSSSLPENILEGTIRDRHLETAGGFRINLPPGTDVQNRRGPVTVLLDPRRLVLSLDAPPNMENRVRGRVSSVREQGGDVWIKIDCGLRLTAIISRTAYEEMGINLHREVVVSFVVDAVEVL
jgi:tungstate transport system ATP-binding protein